MNVADFFIDLDKIKTIVERWSNGSDVNALERDLVLDKLKALYEQVLFERPVSNGNDVMQTIDLSDENEEFETERAEIIGLNIEEDKIEQTEQQQEQIVVEQRHQTQQSEPALDAVDQPVIEAEPEIEAEAEAEAEPEIEAEIEPEPVSAPVFEPEPIEVVNQSLFSEESIPVKQKMDRRVILSLYGDEPMQEQYVEKTVTKERSQPVHRAESEHKFQVESRSQAEQRSEQTEKPKDVPQLTTVDKPHAAVLGDVIGQGNHTVGDNMMFTVVDRVDVATKVVTEQSTSLRKMIGINDKFLMIRDLFNGDAMSYEQAIDSLEVFNDLDDALIYIHESYSWNPNSGGVKLLIELLTRKLS